MAIPKKQRDTISSTLKRTKCLLLERESSLKKDFLSKGDTRNIELREVQQQQTIEPEVEQTPQEVEERSTDLDTHLLRRSIRKRHVPK